MINTISDGELDLFTLYKQDSLDYQDVSIREIAIELLSRRRADRLLVNICENPRNRSRHTLLQMCQFLDSVLEIIFPEAQDAL